MGRWAWEHQLEEGAQGLEGREAETSLQRQFTKAQIDILCINLTPHFKKKKSRFLPITLP